MQMRMVVGSIISAVCTVPFVALAFPFGGPIGQIIFCYNNAIYANVGPPRGGPFIWTPSTKTYQFGPPQHSGQYLLGLAAPPYYCVVSKSPVIVWSGILMTMEGSSGAPAPAYSGALPTPTSTAAPSTTQLPSGNSPVVPATPSLGRIAISEVYYNVESARGSAPSNQWVELYNGTGSAVDISGWSITNSTTGAPRTIPSGTSLPANSFAIITPVASTKTYWTAIPANVSVAALGASIGTGLTLSGDLVTVRNSSGQVVDSVSWGTNATVVSPPLSVVGTGHSLARKSLTSETHTGADWFELPNPSPGR